MAEVYDTPEMIAKEITLEAMKKVEFGGKLAEENLGNYCGRLYKIILKNVREAYDKKYD